MRPSQPRVALVHEWLTGGTDGSTRILQALTQMFPDAPVYVLAADGSSNSWLDRSRVRPSIVQPLAKAIGFRRSWLLPLLRQATENMRLGGFDLAISVSTAFAKNLDAKGAPHLCYCCSPMRFAWDHYPQYLDERSLRGPLRLAADRTIRRLREWDLAGTGRVTSFVAISEHVAARIERYYQRNAPIVYPPVPVHRFPIGAPPPPSSPYLCVSRLSAYKRIDLAVAACCALGRTLTVVGVGAEAGRLRRMACPLVSLVGRVEDRYLPHLYHSSRALLFPGEEDFGIVMVEALAAGRPVIAFAKGGGGEIVQDGRSGVTFDDQSVACLAGAIGRFESLEWAPASLHERAKRFSVGRFVSDFASQVGGLLPGYRIPPGQFN